MLSVYNPDNEYNPDSVSPPCETIAETIRKYDESLPLAIERSGIECCDMLALATGRSCIDLRYAEALERAFGVPASFWLKCQKNFDEAQRDWR